MNALPGLMLPLRVYVEMQDKVDRDACDVIVEMEDGGVYTALFVTLPYLHRQMELSFQMAKQMHDMPAVRYAAMETPHILVENLDRETLEDILDNLLTLGTFASLFTPVMNPNITDEPEERLRTAEVAAVVLNEVLQVEPDTVA